MSELQAILEKRRRRADATRDNGGDTGGEGDDGTGVVAVAAESSPTLRPNQQYSQSYVLHNIDNDGEGGRVEVQPTSAGRVALRLNTDNIVPTPPSQLPSKIHSYKANAGERQEETSNFTTRTKVEGSVAYINKSSTSMMSSSTPQEELQKKLLERRMKFGGESGTEETKSYLPEDAVEEGTLVPSSRVDTKWNNKAMTNKPHVENAREKERVTTKSNNVKFEWNNRTKRLEPVVQASGDDMNNPVTSNTTPTFPAAQSLPIPQSQISSASASRTGGFFKRTSPHTNSTTRPVYGAVIATTTNRQPSLPQQQHQQHQAGQVNRQPSQQQQQQQPYQIGERPSSLHNPHQTDQVRRTVAGRGGGGNRRGAPQSATPVSMLSSMAAKYKEEMKDQLEDEEIEKHALVQATEGLTTDSIQSAGHNQQQDKAITKKSTEEEVVLQSQPNKIPSTPPRRSNANAGQSKVLPASSTTSDDGSAGVPEFMRMRLRSTPNKRRSAMGAGEFSSSSTTNHDSSSTDNNDVEDVSAVASHPRTWHASQQQPQSQQSMTPALNVRNKIKQQSLPITNAANLKITTTEDKIRESVPGQQHRQEPQTSVGDSSTRGGKSWQHRPTNVVATNHQRIQSAPQQEKEPNDKDPSNLEHNDQQQVNHHFSQTATNTYNTAVLAAKNAIDLSNRSRIRSWRKDDENDKQPQSLENSKALPLSVESVAGISEVSIQHQIHVDVIDGSFVTKDPSLLMEPTPDPSPSSSLVVEEDIRLGQPLPIMEKTMKPHSMETKKGNERGGKSNVKNDRISRLAHLLATDEYDDVVPTTPSAVVSDGAPIQPDAARNEKNCTGNQLQAVRSGDEEGDQVERGDNVNGGDRAHGEMNARSFFGHTTDSEVASHTLHSSDQDKDTTPPDANGFDGDGFDNAFSSDPFALTTEFGMAALENNDACSNDRSQPHPPVSPHISSHASTAVIPPISEQSSSFEESANSGNDNPHGSDQGEGAISFNGETIVRATGDEEFIVDVPNFTEGTFSSSMEEDVVLPAKQPVLTHLLNSQSRQVDGVMSQEIPDIPSFHVQELDSAFANGLQCDAEPIKNPLSGNLIICRCRSRNSRGFEFGIEEVDINVQQPGSSPLSSTQSALVVLGHISTDEIEAKLMRVYSAGNNTTDGGNVIKVLGVSSILSLSAGVHRVKGRARVRVAVLAEIFVLSRGASKLNNRGGIGKKIRVVAVWRWGYASGSKLASLQSVLTLDSIDNVESRCGYDPKTLQVADGLLFLGGCIAGRDADNQRPTSTAAVFIAKPSVRNFWTSVPLGHTNAARALTLAVTSDDNSFLAVGLSDGSVHVLTYGTAARTNRLNLHKHNASLLHTLYYIHGEVDVRRLSDNDCLWAEQNHFISITDHIGSVLPPTSIDCMEVAVEEKDKPGRCTALSWIERNSSGISTLPLLAAAFSSGIAVYQVENTTHHPTETTPTLLAPLAQAKFFTSIEEKEFDILTQSTHSIPPRPRTKLCWSDLGPRTSPCLTVLVEHERHSYQSGSTELLSRSTITRLCLCAIDIPWYGSVELTSSFEGVRFGHRSIGVIAQKDFNYSNSDALSIVSATAMGVILCYSSGRVLACSTSESHFSSLLQPVASAALGLDSDGSVYFGSANPNAARDCRDLVLSVFSVAICGEFAFPTTARGINPSIPSLRHWLLISSPGDKENDGEYLDSDNVKRGASVDILFELTCGENPVAGLIPIRTTKEHCGRRVAVMFSSGLFRSGCSSSENRVRTQPKAYTILDIETGVQNRGSAPFSLRHGRDVAFLQPSLTNDGFYCSSLVVLDSDGSAISLVTAINSSDLPEGENERIVEPIDKCSLQYEGIEGLRVFALLNGNQPEILIAGYCKLTGLHCLLLSMHSLEGSNSSSQPILVENSGMGHRLWLRRGESIISAQELPRHGKAIRSNVAIASQERVMIVSPNDSLAILSEIDVHLSCTSLSSLGSHCVAFCATLETSGSGKSQLMYLSCLEDVGRHGCIANIPTPHHGRGPTLLTAIRPDRMVYLTSHSGLRLVDKDDDEHTFVAPLPCTRPVFLLEPLIANALCLDGARGSNASIDSGVQCSIRTILEKYGRKDLSFPHGDNQGIGSKGAGVTALIYKMLAHHKCFQAASVLLNGNLPVKPSPLSMTMPPWVPFQSKLSASKSEILLQSLLYRDDNQPRLPDLSSILAEELAFDVLKNGSSVEAVKCLDLAGRQSSESLLAQLAISLDYIKLLEYINNSSGNVAKLICNRAELCWGVGFWSTQLVQRGSSSDVNDSCIPVSQLAPSVQSTFGIQSVRGAIMSNDVFESLLPALDSNHLIETTWMESLRKDLHVWRTGPFGIQENLLELSDLEDWLGRCCPSVLGKEGVAIASTSGERTLAEILLAAARSEQECGASALGEEISRGDRRKSWVEGVGEGRTDEDNLSLYIRFSEGADEDVNWKTDGFTDLTKYAHAARLFRCDLATVEATTSSVDEGEEGKVRLLYDLVYHDGAQRDKPTGLVVQVPRGGSLDIGMLHGAQHTSRKRCTIELWYHLPQAHIMIDEVILVRRSLVYEENDDVSKLCMPDEKHNVLWELAVLPTGLLELRTGAGSVITSDMHTDEVEDGLVSWGRDDGGGGWNHVCLVFSSLSKSKATEFSATILMNGSVVVPGATLSVNPFGSGTEHDLSEEDIEESMESTLLIFGIGPSVGFRMTDLRVWACERSEDDIRTMMYEYLKDAEMKKKLKVNIRKGLKKSTADQVVPLRLRQPESKKGFALAPPPSPGRKSVPGHGHSESTDAMDTDFMPSFADFPNPLNDEIVLNKVNTENVNYFTADDIIIVEEGGALPPSLVPTESAVEEKAQAERLVIPELEVIYSDMLSTQVRKSAAAAIIRGPPAARHFGGNRGGLLFEHVNFGSKCDGVSPIAICGADKSVVWFSDRDPPGKTYPVGASGAVLSDVMDADQREYMCCFLAKEKRMVVFELSRKSVLVELQMKTKLNFWRYLPPEAHGSELVFVLITPIGGFHWKPLDKMPRPCQVWKRGPELESKKILTYEEGGSNGLTGANARSAVALVTVSSSTQESMSVEAYCIAMYSGSSLVCISNVILGAALYRPTSSAASPCHFLPYVITISMDVTSQLVLDVENLIEESGQLARGSIVASTVLDLGDNGIDELYEPPSMSMGHTPEVLCCCHNGFVVAAIRRRGLIFIYDFSDGVDLSPIGQNQLGQYIVDAAIRSRNADDSDVAELALLLANDGDSMDGRVATVNIHRVNRV